MDSRDMGWEQFSTNVGSILDFGFSRRKSTNFPLGRVL